MLKISTSIFINGVLLSLSFPLIRSESTTCRPGECCVNHYQAEDGTCQECPLGKFGINCTEECPSGYYGRLCRQNCRCASETCDPVQGCDDRTTVRNFTGTTRMLHYRKNTWRSIAFVLFGSTVTIVVVMGLFYLKFRLEKIQDTMNRENDDAEEEYQHLEHLPGTTYNQRANTVDEENDYTDLRSSRMIETQNERIVIEISSLPRAEEFENEARNEQQDEYMHLMQIPSTEESKERDKEETEYGYFSDSGQYNMLSLRRTIDPMEIRRRSEEQTPIYKMLECDTYPNSLMRACESDNDLNTMDSEYGNLNTNDNEDSNIDTNDKEDNI
ncbi:uncharacterized protein LOC125664036 isoform X2 [Ostrea edulis]|uniref:uncharacterized protein LOC125664036 isoform X2 n=1 Tax=Ostrea edulis TaxID=37623 RepID=UPI0024AFE4F3|nr:uncharacterized protein LOC125664036 isoform X2 [Ostrea edulis]